MENENVGRGEKVAPVLTWLGAALSLLFVVHFTFLWNGKMDPRGFGGEFLGVALYGVPLTGTLMLWAGGMRNEKAAAVRAVFGSL